MFKNVHEIWRSCTDNRDRAIIIYFTEAQETMQFLWMINNFLHQLNQFPVLKVHITN